VQRSARAYWTVGPEQGELREEPLPEPLAGQVLVETLHSAISRGTELLVHRGAVPESEHARMRAPHQRGEFPWPVKYGYCNVGRVVAGGAGTNEWLERTVFCLYPHQRAYVVDAGEKMDAWGGREGVFVIERSPRDREGTIWVGDRGTRCV
jgi:NADPH:quinone reductase-like Zn-dependent oxidoreductase